MLGRACLLVSLVVAAGCSGGSFDVGTSDGTDTGGSIDDSGGTSDSSTTDDTGTITDSGATDETSVPPDSGVIGEGGLLEGGIEVGPIDGGPGCPVVASDTINLYVDASASAGGNGALGCPFRTIREALAVPKASGVLRTIHVKAGDYAESDLVNIGNGVTVVSEGGPSKITGGSSSNCSGISDKCVVRIEGPGTLDGFVVDAGGVAVGMVAGSGASPSKIQNSTIKNANKTGLIAIASVDVSAVHVDDNGDSNVWVRNGTFHVLPGTNTFDRSKGKGGSVSGTFIPAAGIVVFGSGVLNFEGGTANENQSGIQFDWASASSAKQSISGLSASSNRAFGVQVPHGQKLVQIRKSTLLKNSVGGLFLEYDSTGSNVFDLGSVADPGNNVYGGATSTNTKVGVFICRSPTTLLAEGTKFSVCPPTQVAVAGCDVMPGSYADVGYAPTIMSGSGGPLVDTTCTVGP
ncbi:MAG: hypothetical protein ACXWUG_04345 [Polyangiales bacterium]